MMNDVLGYYKGSVQVVIFFWFFFEGERLGSVQFSLLIFLDN